MRVDRRSREFVSNGALLISLFGLGVRIVPHLESIRTLPDHRFESPFVAQTVQTIFVACFGRETGLIKSELKEDELDTG